jgi:predicted transcriptional regulator YdeE
MFFGKDIYSKIPNKIDDRIYAVYGNFEEWFSQDSENKNYDLIIGCKVESLEWLPKWLSNIEIPEQDYAKFVAVWNMPWAVLKQWEHIWNSDIKKNFSVDFEVYSQKSQQGKNSEVDIYVWVDN